MIASCGPLNVSKPKCCWSWPERLAVLPEDLVEALFLVACFFMVLDAIFFVVAISLFIITHTLAGVSFFKFVVTVF